jgi:hypothetical protein
VNTKAKNNTVLLLERATEAPLRQLKQIFLLMDCNEKGNNFK